MGIFSPSGSKIYFGLPSEILVSSFRKISLSNKAKNVKSEFREYLLLPTKPSCSILELTMQDPDRAGHS